jgi:hypothetical protein
VFSAYCIYICHTLSIDLETNGNVFIIVLNDNPRLQNFLEDGTAKQRLVASYKLMLDFYGIELSNDITGEVKLANNWRERFDNLERLEMTSFGHLTVIILVIAIHNS